MLLIPFCTYTSYSQHVTSSVIACKWVGLLQSCDTLNYLLNHDYNVIESKPEVRPWTDGASTFVQERVRTGGQENSGLKW